MVFTWFFTGTKTACTCSPVPAVSQLKRLPSADRPRERLLEVGREALSDVELVALVIGGDLDCAAALVAALGGAVGLRRAFASELRAVPGIGTARACQLLAALELGRRAMRTSPSGAVPSLRGPAQAAEHLVDLALLEQEELHVIGVDSRHRPLGRFLAARGSLNVVHVAPREVFRRLVRDGAAAAIVAHNHPSRDPAPSVEDGELTARLRAAGELVGIPLLDHLVIAEAGYHSFTDGTSRPLPRRVATAE
jgi:DNA repair protein RadC